MAGDTAVRTDGGTGGGRAVGGVARPRLLGALAAVAVLAVAVTVLPPGRETVAAPDPVTLRAQLDAVPVVWPRTAAVARVDLTDPTAVARAFLTQVAGTPDDVSATLSWRQGDRAEVGVRVVGDDPLETVHLRRTGSGWGVLAVTTPVLRFRVPEMPDVVHTIGSATFVTDVEGEAAVDVRDAQSGAVLGRWRQGVDTANTWTANVNVTAPSTDRPGFLLVTVLGNRARAVAVLPVMLSAVRQGASAG